MVFSPWSKLHNVKYFEMTYLYWHPIDLLTLHAFDMHRPCDILKYNFAIKAYDLLSGHRLYLLCDIEFSTGQMNEHMLVKLIDFILLLLKKWNELKLLLQNELTFE